MAGFNQNNKRFNQAGYGGNQQSRASLPAGYLAGEYYDVVQGEKVLKKDYIVKYPEEIARALSDREESKNNKRNKRSQIRKFYDYTLRINDLLVRKAGNFALVEGELNRLIPFVKYAGSRDTVSDLFVSFIVKNISMIKNADDMRAFVKHFEALVAYLPKEKN
ncbi:MAG: type III-A CRISPR-associated protein Csm2 [Lachnospiraceae bacterium]|nr:type III-A CRISPR-associated protein Csm2 [Lachnospiraceae bacterium]